MVKKHFTFFLLTSPFPEEHHALSIMVDCRPWHFVVPCFAFWPFSTKLASHIPTQTRALLLPLDRRSHGGIGLEEVAWCLRLEAILEPCNLQDWPLQQWAVPRSCCIALAVSAAPVVLPQLNAGSGNRPLSVPRDDVPLWFSPWHRNGQCPILHQKPDLTERAWRELNLEGGCSKMGADFFSQVACDRKRGDGLKLQQGRFRLGFRLTFFSVMYWHRCPGRWWSYCPWRCVEMWHWVSWLVGMRLDFKSLVFFSNCNNLMILNSALHVQSVVLDALGNSAEAYVFISCIFPWCKCKFAGEMNTWPRNLSITLSAWWAIYS